jgi:hypothetical protein
LTEVVNEWHYGANHGTEPVELIAFCLCGSDYSKASSTIRISIITSFAGTESGYVPRSARAMQDGVGLALLHFLQQLTDFRCGRRNELDTAPFRLR